MAILPAVSSAMHGALVPIASYTFPGGTNSAGFLNIPQGYQDLRVICSIRSTAAGAEYFATSVNAGTPSSSASFTSLFGNGSSASSERATNTSNIEFRGVASAANTTGIFSSVTVDFLSYSNTSTYKTILSRNASDFNGSGITNLTVNNWRSTNGISRLDFFTYNGNLVTGSTVTLYGIRSVGQ